MAERRAGLGRGLGELFQRTDGEELLDPVDQHVIVGRSGPTPDADAGTGARTSRSASKPSLTERSGLDVSRGTRARSTAGRTTPSVAPTGAASADRPDHVTVDPANGYFAEIPIGQIQPNAKQPRTHFEEEALDELVGSIREVGLLQPIVVRKDGADSYELVMGERRWRASRQAGLRTVPAIVRATTDDAMLRDALLENIHRVQLNPLEEAAAYQQLMEDFGCTQQVLADRIKRSRSQIANTLRLLNLPPTLQRRVAAGSLSAGHARALLGLPDVLDQEQLAERIIAEGLSVRATEELVALAAADRPRPRPRTSRNHDPQLQEVSVELESYFETKVQVTQGRNKGKIVLEFASKDDLNRIVRLLRP